jgi:hypothetical protein
MSKQKLSPKAAKAKAVRDLAAANSPARKEKRADSQKKRREAEKKNGKDWLKGKDQVIIGVVRNLNIRKTALKPRTHLKKQNKWQVFTHTQR